MNGNIILQYKKIVLIICFDVHIYIYVHMLIQQAQ